ncbi:helix-turn-helix domain-containing protein [Nonomuraea purpurea]|uniref:Helix-turn-helix domain-containing protein n=1 Tax=Nonomuraea purpurea TaxID=1849276 RepID=A0ABV8G5U7_9ACTN
MKDVGTIGAALKRLRRERGLGQEALADKAQLSKDLIQKLEQGRRESCRLSSLMKLANALDVDISDLTGKRERLGTDRDGGSVLAIRDAILAPYLMPGLAGLDADDDGAPTPLSELEAAVSRSWSDYWSGDFGPLVAAVPGLITEARLTHHSVGPTAAAMVAQSYQLAACLLLHFGKTDLAAIGAERGLQAATQGEDEWQWASVVSTLAWVLMYQGRLRESEQLAAGVAARIEPSFSAPLPHLASWGNLLIAAIDTAAIAGRDVSQYVSMAAAGAERLGGLVTAYQTTFGASKVAANAVHAFTMQKNPGAALKTASRVRIEDLPPIAYGHHLLDLAQAHTDARHLHTAEARLEEARALSPVWFRHQLAAQSIVADIREQQTRPSATIRRLARAVDLD